MVHALLIRLQVHQYRQYCLPLILVLTLAFLPRREPATTVSGTVLLRNIHRLLEALVVLDRVDIRL